MTKQAAGVGYFYTTPLYCYRVQARW